MSIIRPLAGLAAVAITAAAVLVTATPAEAQTFTGPRVEATIGWDQLRYDLGTAAGSTREKGTDLGYGVTVGYDREVQPNLVIGVEGGALFSDGDYARNSLMIGNITHVRRDLSVAARIGTRVGASTLLYGKVGYSNLQLATDALSAAGTTYARRNYDGVLLGAGAEVGLTANTYLKSEYRYTNYEDGVSRQNILTGIGIRF